MGRKIVCPDCGSMIDEDILKAKHSENTCLVCGADLGGNGNGEKTAEEHPDWITWYYYGDKDDNGKTTTLRDKPIDLNKWTDEFLIKEFKAPPRDSNGSSEKAKEILRTYIPDAFAPAKEPDGPVVRCPYCFSQQYTLLNKGYSLFTGFLGSGRIKRVCNHCKREF